MEYIGILISIGIMSIIPLMLATIFNKLDNSIDISLKQWDVTAIIIVAIVVPVARFLLYRSVGTNIGLISTIHMDLIAAYLVFMSYTDQKTKLLYTSVSLTMVAFELICVAFSIESILEYVNELTWTLMVIPVILFIISVFDGIGLGDVYIYVVICLYTLQISHIPTLVMIISILMTNIMFVITTVFLKVVRKNKDKHLPLTIYITIASIICNTVFINF